MFMSFIFSCAVILGVPGSRVVDQAAGLGRLLTGPIAGLVAATPRVNAGSSTMKRIAVGVIHKTYAGWPLGRFAPVRLGYHACRLREADRSLTYEHPEGGGIEQNADQLFDVCLVSGLQQLQKQTLGCGRSILGPPPALLAVRPNELLCDIKEASLVRV